MNRKPIIIVSVTSDLNTDQRVNRTCMVLIQQGFDVILAGRELPASFPLEARPYTVKRFKLLFHKGPLFYAAYNIRLFLFLWFHKANALFANDLDTLAANYLASRLKGIPLVYDSHEYYTGVPELENRPFVQGIWRRIEKAIFPKLNTIITVNQSIADLYKKEYGKDLIVIRNVPIQPSLPINAGGKQAQRRQLGLPEDKKIIVLQGAGINIDRGSEEAVQAMQFVDNAVLLIIGGGDVMNLLTGLVSKLNLESKIIFKPRMPYLEMMKYTAACDLGLTFDKGTNLNYRFSLPNKVFDYIHAAIPILASRLPEVEKIVKGYDIGDFIESHDPRHIGEMMTGMLSDEEKIAQRKKNLQLASQELNWEKESEKFPDITHELRR